MLTKTPAMMHQAIAYRQNKNSGVLMYVAQLPGDGGKDWGYDRAERAIPLNRDWQRRFAADCRHCGDTALFLSVPKSA